MKKKKNKIETFLFCIRIIKKTNKMSKAKSKTQKNLEAFKRVRGIDRQIAIENGTYHINWMPKSSAHKNDKKHNDKYASRKFKQKQFID